jgi:hypothetical protein
MGYINLDIEAYIMQNIESVNSKIEFTNNPDNNDQGYYGESELNMQLATALYYAQKLKENDFDDIDELDLIYDDATIYGLLNKYQIRANFDFVYGYDSATNKVFDNRKIEVVS